MTQKEKAESTNNSSVTKKKGKKAEKPDLEEFCMQLKEAACGDSIKSRRAKAVHKLLNQGFELEDGEKLQPDDAKAVFDAIRDADILDDLALLLIENPPSNRKPLAEAICRRLQLWAFESLDFPKDVEKSEDRLFDIKNWMREQAALIKGSDGRPCPDEWVRRVFVVLANELKDVRYLAVHQLLETVAVHRESVKSHSEDRSKRYLSWIANRLRIGKSAELVSNRILDYHMTEKLEEFRKDKRKSDDDRLECQLKNESITAELKKIQIDKKALESQVQKLEGERASLQSEIEEIRANADKEKVHLEHEFQQRLTSQRVGVAKTVLHDLGEAILCLDREEPNVSMAMNRINQAEKAIKQQGAQ
jgi:hypothetical protein